MSNLNTNLEATLLTQSALINLYILDLNPINTNTIFYFHDGANQYFQPITFAGQAYTPFPIKMSNFGYNGDGTIARPAISVSNIGGFVSNLLLQGQDLEGANLTRRRVFSKFLDAVNFPNGNPNADPTAAYPDEIYIINQKKAENATAVSWELAPPFDLNSAKLPGRLALGNFCQWNYRGGQGCSYSGAPLNDSRGNSFIGYYGLTGLNNKGAFNTGTIFYKGDYCFTYSNQLALQGVPLYFVCIQSGVSGQNPINNPNQFVQDGCSKSLSQCKLHFPYPNVLPTSSMPGISRSPWILGSSQPE